MLDYGTYQAHKSILYHKKNIKKRKHKYALQIANDFPQTWICLAGFENNILKYFFDFSKYAVEVSNLTI